MPLPLVFGVHNHQPLGNFPHVIERLTRESYLPFLEAVKEEPRFRFSLHVSGILLKWWEDHFPRAFDLLGEMVSRGQIEPVAGGFFEPILAVIPREDRKEQVLRHKDYLRRSFGVTPEGLWLTERVWEQALVEDLVDLGIKYVVVDDRHFLVSGFEKQALHGYYLTEAEGKRLAVFPIDETLRYAIPFWPVERLERYLRDVALRGGRLAIYFDDGEKFGAWPGTRKWVYEEGWLESFLRASAQWQEEGRVEIITFSEALKRTEALGLAYLPTASYKEMEEWALPAKRILELKELTRRLRVEGTHFEAFIRGGHWRNFFVKYPESNYLHKRMYRVSALSRDPQLFDQEARLALLASQCNDAYWHGIFGGLYLPHLRQAVWESLLEAEQKLRARGKEEIELVDLDYDGREEVVYTSPEAVLVFKPSYGGQLVEWSSLGNRHNYGNVLTRRFEAYHEDILHLDQEGGHAEEEVSSIHHLQKRPSAEVVRALVYDWYERHSLMEHFFDPQRGLEDFVACDFGEWGDFANQPYHFHRSGEELLFFRDGGLYPPGSERRPLLLRKFIRLRRKGRTLVVRYELEYRAQVETRCFFGVEMNFYPPFMAHGQGRLLVNGRAVDPSAPFETQGNRLTFTDDKTGERLLVKLPETLRIFCFPVRTVNQSEKGYELTTQGLAVMPFWPLDLRQGKKVELSLELEISKKRS